ncbi:Uncharacterised protein [Mycobacteroides abscessus subsp. abscessus]|nr:Uncharacterised protein [Mycobacteroides abscessus subsp. abscessus]
MKAYGRIAHQKAWQNCALFPRAALLPREIRVSRMTRPRLVLLSRRTVLRTSGWSPSVISKDGPRLAASLRAWVSARWALSKSSCGEPNLLLMTLS